MGRKRKKRLPDKGVDNKGEKLVVLNEQDIDATAEKVERHFIGALRAIRDMFKGLARGRSKK